MPMAVNLSFGNSYGAHDGSSLLERFMDNASEIWKNVICAGSGNEGASAGHVSGRLSEGGPGQLPADRAWSWLWEIMRARPMSSCGKTLRTASG